MPSIKHHRIKKEKVVNKKRKKTSGSKNKSNIKCYAFVLVGATILVALLFLYRFYFKGEFYVGEDFRIKNIIVKNRDKVYGIDISHYQNKENINWQSFCIEQEIIPISFVISRATMGCDSSDKHFQYFWKKSRQYRYVRGAYHFYRPDENPIDQARNYLSAVRLEKGDMPPILDVEILPLKKSKKQFLEEVNIWLEVVFSTYKIKPIVYTSASFYNDYLFELKGYPLWIANYNDVAFPIEEDKWMMWQFSDKARITGIDEKVDVNMFNGNFSELKSYTIH